ncbi:hypothetical protein ABIE17_000521 [Lelliottia nimipressuralis]|uniref:hypothetical protein n=1 Tax=Lelliottia nimipressuralis TaxID=69220 RepID=UPI003D1DF49E
MTILLRTVATLPLLLPLTVSADPAPPDKVDYLSKISFHSPSMPGFRTAEMLSTGFTGAYVTMSSNSESLNLNDLKFSVNHDWIVIKPQPVEGRIQLRMIRQPRADERAMTLTLKNLKTGNTQRHDFFVETWLTGDGELDKNFARAREHCARLGAKLLSTQEFRTLSRQWFGLSSGRLRDLYPEATIFNQQMQAGDSFWVHEAKPLYLHTGAKSNNRNVGTLCRHQYDKRAV